MFLLFNIRQGCNLNYVVFIMQLLKNEKIIAFKLNRTVTINCGKIGIQIIAYYFLTGKRGPQIIISVIPYLHSENTPSFLQYVECYAIILEGMTSILHIPIFLLLWYYLLQLYFILCLQTYK